MARAPAIVALDRDYAEQVWKHLIIRGCRNLTVDAVVDSLMAAAVSKPSTTPPRHKQIEQRTKS